MKAEKYEVLTWVLKKIQVLSDVTACRMVESDRHFGGRAAMKKKGERYSETLLTIYQSTRCNISKDLSKSIALIILTITLFDHYRLSFHVGPLIV